MLRAIAAGSMALLTGCANLGLTDTPSSQTKAISNPAQLQSALDYSVPANRQRTARKDVPNIEPAALIGASGTQIETWLGTPDALWTEGGHALWRYASTGCVVLLFFDPGDRVQKVSLLRSDGISGTSGCERAISNRVTVPSTS